MYKSQNLDKIFPALIAAQKAVKNVKKNAENPHFRNKYANLEAILEECKEPLLENGLSVFFMLDQCDGKPALRTTLIHESGQWIESLHPMMAAKMDAQGIMGYVTYAKRYSLSSLMGITCDDDDDGETSQGRGKHSEAKAKTEEKIQQELIHPEYLKHLKNLCKELPNFEERVKKYFKVNDLSKISAKDTDTIIKNAEHELSKKLKALEKELTNVAI